LCLSTATIWHPVFDLVLPSLEVLEQLLQQSSICIVPGTLEILQSKAAPTINWFNSLPAITYKHFWAIYLLVWERPDSRPKIYVGSGTESQKGVGKRLGEYDHGEGFSTFCNEAVDEGYKRTHTTLVWFPIPKAADRPALRAAFLTIEAALAILLWAIVSPDEKYSMPALCPWDIHTLHYDGLCSHKLNAGISKVGYSGTLS
jgi:hypothetical protein